MKIAVGWKRKSLILFEFNNARSQLCCNCSPMIRIAEAIRKDGGRLHEGCKLAIGEVPRRTKR